LSRFQNLRAGDPWTVSGDWQGSTAKIVFNLMKCFAPCYQDILYTRPIGD
jgi:hypothetical protein